MNLNIKQNSSKLFYEGASGSCLSRTSSKPKESIAPPINEWLQDSLTQLKSKLSAATLGTILGCSLLAPTAFAQTEDQVVEEIIVTGISGSIKKSADIKRKAQGIVDAISTEDIGKFPDTNLAESLQRISGVSIDRANNEGSKVTVRGFGPDFNLVTLNGRQMATSALDGFSRSFDFADIASEGISSVEIHKTFKATSVSGGIGSLINIKTARPLDNPGQLLSLGIKGVLDTSSIRGEDITPEFSGIYSNTFADDTFGLAVVFSHQRRDSRTVAAEVANDWTPNLGGFSATTLEDNRPLDADGNPTVAIWTPQNYGYGIEDIERSRTNAHVVLQWAPSDTLEATLDYTYARFKNAGLRNGIGVWFGDAQFEEAEFNENGSVVYLHDTGADYAYNQRLNTSRNKNEAIGFNLDWQASENFNLAFDAQNSTASSRGTGRGDNVFFILATPFIDNKILNFRDGNQIPSLDIDFIEGETGIVDGVATPDSVDSLFGEAILRVNETEIDQFQLDGTIYFNDSFFQNVKFGFDATDVNFRIRQFQTGQLPAGFYGRRQDVYPSSIFTSRSTQGLLDAFSGGNNFSPNYYYDWDWEAGVAAFEDEFLGGDRFAIDASGTPAFDHRINEETVSPYVQAFMEGDLGGQPFSILAGLRIEQTDITSNSLVREPLTIAWTGPTEYNTILADGQSFSDERGSYDLVLPNFDIRYEFLEGVIARFSISRSVTRPSLQDLQGTLSVNGRPKPGDRTANAGNPDLKPFTADNVDLSLEWHYGDGSYMSAGFFHKTVENFIVVQETEQIIRNLRDPRQGPRAMAAIATLGGTPADEQIFAEINRVAGAESDATIVQDDNDPLITWRVAMPTNLEQVKIYGWEFAIQHVFGESGFGVQANLTLARGNLDVDVDRTGFQFVLPGLSDSYNLVAFYDKGALQARLAYNWRDEFLSGLGAKDSIFFTEKFGQLDFSVSWHLTESFALLVEGINVNGASQRVYNRYPEQIRSATQFDPRYNIGMRYIFK